MATAGNPRPDDPDVPNDRNAELSPDDDDNLPPSDPTLGPWGVAKKTWLIAVGAALGGLLALIAVCSVPDVVNEFQPEPPAPTPTIVPTYTPVPTWTPVPVPTVTPRPVTSLPIQQLHYDKYRIFHFLYEYTLCYQEHITEPKPTRVPKPTATLAPGQSQPTPTPRPTPTPDNLQATSFTVNNLRPHRPPLYGLGDEAVEDHVLRDVHSAARWLISRYQDRHCSELTQFTLVPDRLTWLHRYSTGPQ